MSGLPPRLKHVVVSRASLALEAAACALRWTGASGRAFDRAPRAAYRVLAYHQTPPRHAAAFRRQMEWLCRRRRVVALGDLVNEALGGRFPDKDSVAITFDDGFANNFEVAVPVLRGLGVRACFFVTTDFIDLAGKGEAALREWEQRVYRFTRAAEPMRWDQLRALSREGFEIGVHTRSHPDLSRLRPDETRAEVEQSVARLESELGARPVLFAYPYGKSAMAPPPTRSIVMASGIFRAAFSTERGWNLRATSPDWLHRDSMEPHFSPRLLDAFLCGCFDRE